MMLRVVCRRCSHRVDLDPGGILLVDGPAVKRSSPWAYVCPTCGTFVTRVADEWEVMVLLAAGVTPITAPERPVHPEQRPTGPPLTVDDLLDLHVLLAGEDWWRDLAAAS